MESLASHVKGAANEQISIPTNIEANNHNLLTGEGEGITAVVEGKRVYVGNKNEKMLFQRIDIPTIFKARMHITVRLLSNYWLILSRLLEIGQ